MKDNSNIAEKIARHAKMFLADYLNLLHVPAAWVKSLRRSTLLLDGQWSRYMGFQPKHALNCLYYRTQWINIDRYGRNGCSPIVGLGEYPMSRWVHISNFASYVYANAGAVTMLAGTLGWALMHIMWLENAAVWWVLVATLLLTLSATTYAMAFMKQNYNVLGWIWMPLALFAVISEHWILASFAWFAAGLASITVIFVAVPLMLAQYLISKNIEVFLVLIPALAKFVLHCRSFLRHEELSVALVTLAKLIGLIKGRVRYKRVVRYVPVSDIYFSLLYLSASAVSWYFNGIIALLPATAAVIFIINQRIARFADIQSIIIFVVTVFAAHTLAIPPNGISLALLFLVANPLPVLLGIVENDPDSGVKRIAVYEPFDHTQIEQECERMFETVPAGSRMILPFHDPCGIYQDIFDGYRNAIEPLLYVAAHREIHLFPDWHAVAETNTDGEFFIWGRSLDDVRRNMGHWRADYALYYIASDDTLPDEWLNHYRIVESFDFANHLDDLRQAVPWTDDKPCPKFLLLQPIST